MRKWTSLDLYSMATTRDKLTVDAHLLSRQKVSPDYLGIYKIASSVVHADGVAISHGFLDITPWRGGMALVPNRNWLVMSAAFNARYDVIQCFEVLTFLGMDVGSDFLQLQRDWQSVRDKHVADV